MSLTVSVKKFEGGYNINVYDDTSKKPIGHTVTVHREYEFPCPIHEVFGESMMCGLHQSTPKLCNIHDSSQTSMRIITRPIYGSIDEAAMAAANIIRHCMLFKGAHVEYGICIYGNDKDKFCLTETRRGTEKMVATAYGSGHSGYELKAIVHSHPVSADYIHEFSHGDYIISSGGEITNKTGVDLNDDTAPKFELSFKHPVVPIYLVGVLKNSGPYKPGEIITHDGKLWVVKNYVSTTFSFGPSDWMLVKDYDDRNVYEDGEIVFDKKQDWPIYKKVKGTWDSYISTEWTLTKFTPTTNSTAPEGWLNIIFKAIGDPSGQYDQRNAQLLAISMALYSTAMKLKNSVDVSNSIMTAGEQNKVRFVLGGNRLKQKSCDDIAKLFGILQMAPIIGVTAGFSDKNIKWVNI